MFNAVAEGLAKALETPAERLFGLLSEINTNLETSVILLSEIKTALTEEPTPPVKPARLKVAKP